MGRGGTAVRAGEIGVRAIGLHWRYTAGSPIIDDFSLDVGRGLVGIEGSNGSGKSTLLRLLATVVPVQKGELWIAGHDVRRAHHRRGARRRIGYLPQVSNSVPGLREVDWVMYGAWLRELPRNERRAAVTDVCVRLQLDGLKSTPLARLSVGQRRRADLARALVGWPAVCLLDEPTAALDEQHAGLVVELLVEHSKTNAVVVAEHGGPWQGVADHTIRLAGR